MLPSNNSRDKMKSRIWENGYFASAFRLLFCPHQWEINGELCRNEERPFVFQEICSMHSIRYTFWTSTVLCADHPLKLGNKNFEVVCCYFLFKYKYKWTVLWSNFAQHFPRGVWMWKCTYIQSKFDPNWSNKTKTDKYCSIFISSPSK